jgi:hypothetical protein
MVLLFKAGRLCHGVVVGFGVSFGWPARPAFALSERRRSKAKMPLEGKRHSKIPDNIAS